MDKSFIFKSQCCPFGQSRRKATRLISGWSCRFVLNCNLIQHIHIPCMSELDIFVQKSNMLIYRLLNL